MNDYPLRSWDEIQTVVWRACVRRVPPHDPSISADDLAQEVLAALWCEQPNNEGWRGYNVFLYARIREIVYKALIRLGAHGEKDPKVDKRRAMRFLSDTDPAVQDTESWAMERMSLASAFAALTPLQAQVLGAEVAGYSQKEIAAALTLPPRRVKAVTHQALLTVASAPESVGEGAVCPECGLTLVVQARADHPGDVKPQRTSRAKPFCPHCDRTAQPPAPTSVKTSCPICGEDFIPKRSDQRYCSATCRDAWKPARRTQARVRETPLRGIA